MRRASCLLALVITSGCGRILYGDVDAGADGGDSGDDGGDDAAGRTEDGGPSTVCSPLVETCNRLDDDCDGRVDETFELASDPMNCGACATVCPGASSASPACMAGLCTFVCDPGFDDCDDAPDNGCEASLSDPATCGACETPCGDPTPLCEVIAGDAACVTSCDAGFVLCGSRCVSLGTDVENCGGCGTSCLLDGARTSCTDGRCAITACTPPTLDCNGTFSDGCEATGIINYVDVDGDGFGAGEALLTCELVGVTTGGDCDDMDPRAFPGQLLFFTTPRAGGSFDYDCSGGASPEFRMRSVCASGPMCMLLNAGWASAIPSCGMSATFTDACDGMPPCSMSMAPRTQGCR